MDMLPSLFMLLCSISVPCIFAEEDTHSPETYMIEGKISVSGVKSQEWVPHTRIVVDGGLFIGFLK